MKVVSGGPVFGEYNFLKFHMHWGDSIEKGWEHLIDGKSHTAEVWFKYIFLWFYSQVAFCELEFKL